MKGLIDAIPPFHLWIIISRTSDGVVLSESLIWFEGDCCNGYWNSDCPLAILGFDGSWALLWLIDFSERFFSLYNWTKRQLFSSYDTVEWSLFFTPNLTVELPLPDFSRPTITPLFLMINGSKSTLFNISHSCELSFDIDPQACHSMCWRWHVPLLACTMATLWPSSPVPSSLPWA